METVPYPEYLILYNEEHVPCLHFALIDLTLLSQNIVPYNGEFDWYIDVHKQYLACLRTFPESDGSPLSVPCKLLSLYHSLLYCLPSACRALSCIRDLVLNLVMLWLQQCPKEGQTDTIWGP
jgi:hypothetical protein